MTSLEVLYEPTFMECRSQRQYNILLGLAWGGVYGVVWRVWCGGSVGGRRGCGVRGGVDGGVRGSIRIDGDGRGG